ncbi:MAG TPA: hypothetical protein VMW87_01835 [Spirochaetia bacterium]|nr:hypothetical protein [Spirochaetia bacterium]
MVTLLIDWLLRLVQRRMNGLASRRTLARVARRAWLPRSEKIPESETEFGAGLLHHLQEKRLRSTIRFAAKNSPYYRELFETHRMRPADVRSVSDLRQLPVTDSEAMNDWRKFLAVPQEQLLVVAGSAGTGPTRKTVAFTAADWNQVCTARAVAIGMLIGSRRAPGVAKTTGDGDRAAGKGALMILPPASAGWVDSRLFRDALARTGVPLFEAGTDAPEEAVRLLVEFTPALLIGTPHSLDILTRCAADVGFAYRPSAIISLADALSTAVLSRLNVHWDSAVVACYGSAELGGAQSVAFSSCRGTHLNALDLIVEILDPETGDPAALGDLVVTTLLRRAMPLIRYRTGDTARWVQHECRLPFPSLEILGSRTGVLFRNRTIGARELSECIAGVPGTSGRLLWRYENAASGGGSSVAIERAGYGPGSATDENEILVQLRRAIESALPPGTSAALRGDRLAISVCDDLPGQIRNVRIEDHST